MSKNPMLRSAYIALLGSLSFAAHALAGETKALNIPAGDLSAALETFMHQSGMELVYRPEQVEKLQTKGVQGDFSAQDAMLRLLEGTSLKISTNARGAMLIAAPLEQDPTAGVQYEGNSTANSATQDGDEPTRTFLPGVRLAQTEQTLPGASEASNSPALEEVIVTATKREESLQDIPLSVFVLDEQQLVKQGAVDFVDYATRIPNLSFGATGDGALSLFSMQIRGIAGAGTTGFYIDDVPIPQNMNPRVMDISRIEVLRGPQGSLYGARSMGGTVRLITKRADPTKTEFKAHATASSVAEGGADYAVDAAFNVPIAARAAIRSNAYYLRDSGFHDVVVNNPYIVGDGITRKDVDEGEHWGLQTMVTWNVTDNFTVEPRFMYQKSHLDWVPYSDFKPGNLTSRRFADLADPNDQDWSVGSLTLSWNTDWGRFTSATGLFRRTQDDREEFSEWTNSFSTDVGGDPAYYPPGGLLIYRQNKTRQVSEELRFTSDFEGRLQATAGVFYSNETNDALVPCSFAVGLSDATGIPFGTDCIITIDATTKVEELAFFGELEFAIRDNLFVTAGGRYFDNTVETSVLQSGVVVDFGAPSAPRRDVEQKESGFNPKFALKWLVNDDWTLYGSAAKGFRIGGTNGAVLEELCATELAALGINGSPNTFKSDSLWSYEIGSKSSHAGGRFALNAAAFYIDWTDIIQTTFMSSCGSGFTNNTGIAESKGFEIEISGRPLDRLTYSLGVGYTDAEIIDPQNAAGVLAGDPLAQVPKWNFSGNTEYRFPIGTHEGYFFTSYSWVDSSISANAGRSNPRVRDAYGLLDARLGMTVGNWDVSLFGKNLTNKHANLSDNLSLAAEDRRRPRYVTNRPRTIGVDVRWAF